MTSAQKDDGTHEGGRLRAIARKIDSTFLPVFGPAQVTRDEIEREPDPALEARHAELQAAYEVHTTPDGHRYLVSRDD